MRNFSTKNRAKATSMAGSARSTRWRRCSPEISKKPLPACGERETNNRSILMPWSHGQFHWNELMTRDVERAKKFYAATLGWTFEAMPMPGGGAYWIAKCGDVPARGTFDISGPDYKGVPESW